MMPLQLQHFRMLNHDCRGTLQSLMSDGRLNEFSVGKKK